ncbi:hypothetical protein [Bacillus safensis]|uniref:Uncharacterized protein n=1 Tax=Bacillus safensis TaxID=561879 RepID=A0A1L6ZPE5_BACIA|nr:hypothetical protein [Bacillus safensis]APT48373.1 hypothetical protein BSA145_21155 [Bacillus safensis]
MTKKGNPNTKIHTFTTYPATDQDIENALNEWATYKRKSENLRTAIRLLLRYQELEKQQGANYMLQETTNNTLNANSINNIKSEEKKENASIPDTNKMEKNEEGNVLDDDTFRKLMQGRFNGE